MFKAGDRVRVIGKGNGVNSVMHYFNVGDEVTVTVNSSKGDPDAWCKSSTGMVQFVNNNHLELIQ